MIACTRNLQGRDRVLGNVRNPLTAALAAMALHAALSLGLGWPYPSVATFLAGMVAVVVALAGVPQAGRAVGASAALALFVPTVVPSGVLLACLSAPITALIPKHDDPLRNVAVALPALTFLALCMTV